MSSVNKNNNNSTVFKIFGFLETFPSHNLCHCVNELKMIKNAELNKNLVRVTVRYGVSMLSTYSATTSTSPEHHNIRPSLQRQVKFYARARSRTESNLASAWELQK